MKAHKEFCKSFRHPKLGCMLFDGTIVDCDSCKVVWKAALKWAKNQPEYIDTRCEFIEQELESGG